MKTITETETIPERIVQSTVYIAEDGRRFDNQGDCKTYEFCVLTLPRIKTEKISTAPIYTIPTVWHYCKTEEELDALRFKYPNIRSDNKRNLVLNEWIAFLTRDYGDYEYTFVVSKEDVTGVLEECLYNLNKLETERPEKLSPNELEAWKKKVGWSDNGYNIWKSMVKSWATRHGISYKSALSILYDDLPYNKDGEDFITQRDLHTPVSSYYAEYDIAEYGDAESPIANHQNDSSGA